MVRISIILSMYCTYLYSIKAIRKVLSTALGKYIVHSQYYIFWHDWAIQALCLKYCNTVKRKIKLCNVRFKSAVEITHYCEMLLTPPQSRFIQLKVGPGAKWPAIGWRRDVTIGAKLVTDVTKKEKNWNNSRINTNI